MNSAFETRANYVFPRLFRKLEIRDLSEKSIFGVTVCCLFAVKHTCTKILKKSF